MYTFITKRAEKRTTKKRLLVVLSLLAFLMNAVLPFYAVSSVSAALVSSKSSLASAKNADQYSLASLLGDKILICTVADFIGSDSSVTSDINGDDQRHVLFECPLCHLAKGNAITELLIHAFNEQYIEATVSQQYLTFHQNHKTTLLLNGGFTRAPPTYRA